VHLLPARWKLRDGRRHNYQEGERSVNEKSKLHLRVEFMLERKMRVRKREEDLCKSGSADACFHTRDCAYKTIKTKTKEKD
jgi:hypothetical protein